MARCLALILLPVLTLDDGVAATPYRVARSAVPYLPIVGSPSLRFEEALPPPDLVTRPSAGAPPVPALSPAETSVATANADAARSTAVGSEQTAAAQPAAVSSTPPAAPAENKGPAPILPDTARPIVHAEDFLPYFQIPGSARPPGDVSLPPSSATYTQTPK